MIISTDLCATGDDSAIEETALDTPEAGADSELRAFTIPADWHGQRLDKALAALVPEFSRSYLQQLVADGAVRLEGQPVLRSAAKVRAGQRGEVELRPTPQSQAFVPQAMDLDVVYLESCTHEQGTLKRPAVGAVRGIVETAMGRALLASLDESEQLDILERVRLQRPDDHQRCLAGVHESLTHYRKRGFAINLGDAGLGVLAVGVASRIRYGSRQLLFNCAVPGYRVKPQELLKTIGPRLTDMVRMADAQSGVR